MSIRVLFFASIADLARAREMSVEPEGDGFTVGALRRRLEKDIPRLAGKLGKCAAAVNQAVVGAEAGLKNGDEVAFLPPVSGGTA
ncbi:MAG: molybdopterin converting factor subunit 1 [Planctomycetes bacterium]|nr:molybdopterin converting factor subunit 1 [Planctomycetota bacterium]